MSTELQAEQIAAWLRERPYFFTNHAELLGELRIPHQAGTVSLLEYQAQVLREENSKLRDRLAQLTQTAQDNDRLFKATRKLLLKLLAARTLDELLQRAQRCLQAEFQVPVVSLLLFIESHSVSSHYPQHSLTEAEKAIGSLLKGGGQLCAALREEEQRFLFAEQAVQSAAVLPLRGERLYGVLALGSPDPERYRGAQGTLFLDYLGEVLPCLLKRFLPSAQA
ncbi:hypothetical protein AXE65_11115 [Ventosimonas gracilis]|uniref:Phytochrome sensor protein n=1 Tax=Ventosimonas gracilis TaxID=1680762 RepID=A0A139SWV5_9GAMM|nr:DUF484 family protein [Ventosimonas gracilis]KXU38984.1 hypothetical protein AXE65_11115 [Ventosimonas gracilis]